MLALSCRHEAERAPRVIFIGLDGADWRLLDRFTADGTMPQLREILTRAERRVLRSQHPPLSPLVWTSMMTGVSPLEHRILDFTRFNPRTHAVEPITSDERAMPAIWNMAVSRGKKVGVFGLWATAPAEPGVILTDRDLPRDIEAATALTRDRALAWIREQQPDLAVVYFQGTDEIGHLVAGDSNRARPYYARIDAIVGEFRALAEDLGAQLVIASDHGFDWDAKHATSSTAVATAAKWHRDEGIYLRFPVEPPPTRRREAHVTQICATLLDLLALPPGEGIAPPIGDAPAREPFNYRRIFKRPPPSPATANPEAIAKLRSLGYIGSAEITQGPGTRTPASFNNEGLILRAADKPDEAERAFLGALAIDPNYATALWNLSDLLETKDPARSDRLLVDAWRHEHPEARGHLIERARKRRGDLALLTKAIEARDDDALRIHRGRYRLEARDCRAALADFRAMKADTELRRISIAAAEGCLAE